MKVAVFGATGTIGRPLASALASQHDVIGVSRHPPADDEAGVRWVEADAGDADAVRRALDDLDRLHAVADEAAAVQLARWEEQLAALREACGL